jgi:uncharacterized DUF497 family protein
VRIVWDEPKRLSNLDKHEMDFADLTIDFFERAALYPAKGGRTMAIGTVDDEVVTVIFGRLGSEAISVVSMRIAGVKEKRLLWHRGH